jgi:hypothetical protein
MINSFSLELFPPLLGVEYFVTSGRGVSQNTTPFLDRGVYFRLKILGKILEKRFLYFIFVLWNIH